MAITTITGVQLRAGTLTDSNINSSAAIATSKLADAANFILRGGSVPFSADQSIGGFKLTNLGTPTASTDAATKGYADGLAQGLKTKDAVRAATTANITLTGTQTIDGVALSVGDRVLVKNQSTASANGLYLVASGAWTRTVDADANTKLVEGTYVLVEEGTTLATTGWTLTTPGAIVLGTTALAFSQFASAGTVVAGNGLTGTTTFSVLLDTNSCLSVSGTGLKLAVADTTLTVSGSGVKLAALTSANILVGNGSNVATGVAVSGDVTLSNTGVATVSTSTSTGFIKYSALIVRETPSGATNGSNTSYTLLNTPATGMEQVFLNGVLQEPGAGNDYTISGSTITYLTAPATGDRIRVTYPK
jgi:hypothetical protein